MMNKQKKLIEFAKFCAINFNYSMKHDSWYVFGTDENKKKNRVSDKKAYKLWIQKN